MNPDRKFLRPTPPHLLLLPIAEAPKPPSGPAARRAPALLQSESEASLGTTAIGRAVEEMRALVALVDGFLHGKIRQALVAKAWLEQVQMAVDQLARSVSRGAFELQLMTVDDAELADLQEALEGRPPRKDGQANYPSTMLSFWLDEVERRGYELFHLAMGALTLLDAIEVSKQVSTCRYPLR